jgi:hypothetical protein
MTQGIVGCTAMVAIAGAFLHSTHAFTGIQHQPLLKSSSTTCLRLLPPPGSGYAGPEDEVDAMPEAYEPMMEYPGTMRPGRTPENMPFHDLPIADDDPDPVPWPHFQQIEWHHRWAPPHPHPIPMEEFIEQQGRWATPEMEAEMRAGSRRASRTRRQMEEDQKRDTLIMDDDEDDEDLVDDFPQELGEGIFGSLGSTDDAKITADAVSPDRMNAAEDKGSDDDDDDDDAGLDDFLLDLGLDSLGDDDDVDDDDDDVVQPTKASTKSIGLEDVVITEDDEDDISEEENVNPDVTASIDVDDDDDLELGLDEEDDLDDSMEVPLEDFGDGDDDLDADNFFDDGGFDYGDGDGGGDFDGGFD